ncbi:hypothetical protein FB45DRAFT_1055914 [Roridomyces roridus]|uniref:Uncharacterized protein n=1 Tax=Roridomyces roridus TaxID=1738132 RepID=A0AAD7BAK4_9AGAR|nr:hypothetical protein FB45DRAFT_1064456 [Roridomyces roridus]KAJ7636555.1 hypothetical protein FB45DRAFT_1055914 [Roridomyces roridus]
MHTTGPPVKSDAVSEDYAHVKDPELAKHFPPGDNAPRRKLQRRERFKSPPTTSDDEDYLPYSSRRPLKRKGEERVSRMPPPTSVSGARTTKKPRYFSSGSISSAQDSVPLSLPTRSHTIIPSLPPRKLRSPTKALSPSAASSPTTLSAFLESVNRIDLSAHLSLLSAQGFTLERMRIMGQTWTDEMIKEAVKRGLCEAGEEEERKRISVLDALTLELEIRKFRGKAGSSSTPLENSAVIPATLSAFLRNVVGFDLTVHRALFEAQGFDVDRLRAMREWEEEDIREVVGRALSSQGEGAGGMCKLEILAVEFALTSR